MITRRKITLHFMITPDEDENYRGNEVAGAMSPS
jgi:hypothetical protein